MAASRDSIADVWGPRTPFAAHASWPSRTDENTSEEPERWVQSACVLCSNGCALDIGVSGGKIVGVRGRAVDRVNRGRLGPKGLHGWEANNSPDRLTTPLIRSRGRLRKASWDDAMGLIVEQSRRALDESSAGAIGFYTSGQLFLEEYYTLAVIGKAGLGTPHMDGNTRLCTATAARALLESFGADGQPGSYEDLDHADAVLLAGHNVASQQTVLWSRLLDRLDGANPPGLVVIDPRRTETARRATVHLAPKVATNLAVMNGLLHLVIAAGHYDERYAADCTVGFDVLKKTVAAYPPERVEAITGIPAGLLRHAADILGRAERLTSTVLQGFYQSHQASASAVQVNNLHLIRGMIGKPGCGVLQMNGQPTAQNTRECGADGEMPGFRNWHNPDHILQLAKLWNVPMDKIPHATPPTHAMQIFRYAEEGSIRFLWVSGTNPAVSLPDLPRIRQILGKKDLFLVVQDAFPTETTEFATVVLPAALWGEKTGCFTNADRTVHISHKAVDPPGEARSDLDIFLDYARRMDFRDLGGQPLIKWADPEAAFDAWRECSRGRPCDYSGLSYAKLTGGSGIQWPCTEESPSGTARLYTEGRFPTEADSCSDYGHDLDTGAAIEPESYRANDPKGRAILRAVDYRPPLEVPDPDYPLWVTTGRVVYHFHTRTKTARAAELNAAAPEAFVQMHEDDAKALGVEDGDLVEVETRRGSMRARARLGDIIPGHLFIPFHYGDQAANELTEPTWDPASKQPLFKHSAGRASRVTIVDAAEDAAAAVASVINQAGRALKAVVTSSAAPGEGHIPEFLGRASEAERVLAEALERAADDQKAEPESVEVLRLMASWSREHVARIAGLAATIGTVPASEPSRLASAMFRGKRTGGLGLVRDLLDLSTLANEVHQTWLCLHQAGRALRIEDLSALCEDSIRENNRQMAWLRTRISGASAQALAVPTKARKRTAAKAPEESG